jgi:hypothetical protein
MKTVTIRDLRRRRPAARRLRVSPPKAGHAAWSPEAHLARIKKILGDRVFPGADAQIAEDRADRNLWFTLGHDEAQARGTEAAGFKVVRPGRR